MSKEDRHSCKTIIYGIIYGMGSAKMASDLGLSLDKATEKIRSFHRRYPAIATFTRTVLVSARRQPVGQPPCVRTLHGRRRLLPDLQSEHKSSRAMAERQAVNSVIQGTGEPWDKMPARPGLLLLGLYPPVQLSFQLSFTDSALPPT